MVSSELRKRIVEVLEELDNQPEEQYAAVNHTHEFIRGPQGDKGPKAVNVE